MYILKNEQNPYSKTPSNFAKSLGPHETPYRLCEAPQGLCKTLHTEAYILKIDYFVLKLLSPSYVGLFQGF